MWTSKENVCVFRSEKPPNHVLIISCSGVNIVGCILPKDNSSKSQPCQREKSDVSNFTSLTGEDIGSRLLLKVQECCQIIESWGLKVCFIGSPAHMGGWQTLSWAVERRTVYRKSFYWQNCSLDKELFSCVVGGVVEGKDYLPNIKIIGSLGFAVKCSDW